MKKMLLFIAAVVTMTACTYLQFAQNYTDHAFARTETASADVFVTNTPRLIIIDDTTTLPFTLMPTPLLPTTVPPTETLLPTVIPTLAPSVTPIPPTDTPTIAITFPPPTETPPPVWVNALYLAFERGFMAYIEGATCLYAFVQMPDHAGIIIPDVIRAQDMGHYRYCTEFNGLPDAPEGSPEGNFGRVWSYYAEMQTTLGAPLGAVVYYTTTIPPSEPVVMGGTFYSGMITLPDGQALYCGTRGATVGRCELRSGRLPY